MPITPLPQFEADYKEIEEERYRAATNLPETIVVRFGFMKLVGEFPYGGDVRPGCGSKIVVRTHRGTEMGEMLTTTCTNSGCSKSVTRKEMLEYIDNSGGRDYPFHTKGRALRVATAEDMNRQERNEQGRQDLKKDARNRVERLDLALKIIEVEPVLSGDLLTFYYTAEDRIDFRELVRELAAEHKVRIEMRQVGARDEARLTADYERCGQHCCCKNFLKVLKPVSMRSAKVQKATLDPLKISGRCGRLMCCLRYEDQTYEALRKLLPNRKKRVGTPEGVGLVMEGQILTQLVRVRLEEDGRDVVVPVEELCPPDEVPVRKPEPEPEVEEWPAEAKKKRKRRRRRKGAGGESDQASQPEAPGQAEKPKAAGPDQADGQKQEGEPGKKKRRRRRRRKPKQGGQDGPAQGPAA